MREGGREGGRGKEREREIKKHTQCHYSSFLSHHEVCVFLSSTHISSEVVSTAVFNCITVNLFLNTSRKIMLDSLLDIRVVAKKYHYCFCFCLVLGRIRLDNL